MRFYAAPWTTGKPPSSRMLTLVLAPSTPSRLRVRLCPRKISGVGEVEAVTEFISLGSKITEDPDYSHETKRRLLLGRKAMTNLDSLLKSRDITLQTKVRPVRAMVFPVVMYGCESQTIMKAER